MFTCTLSINILFLYFKMLEYLILCLLLIIGPSEVRATSGANLGRPHVLVI